MLQLSCPANQTRLVLRGPNSMMQATQLGAGRSRWRPASALLAAWLAAGIVCHPWAATASGGQLQIVVVDKDTGRPIPCRMHLNNAAGRPRLPKKVPVWDDHFIVPGKIALQLAPGNYSFEVERGLEYLVTRGHFTINASSDDTQQIEMQRFADLASEGWYSGDLDVRRAPGEIALLMQAEDLHVVPLQTWWNGHSQWKGPLAAEKLLADFGNSRYCHFMAGQQVAPGGSLLFFNLPGPLTLPEPDAEYPPPAKVIELARRTGRVWVDAARPYCWDLPAWVAHSDIDSIQVLNSNVCRSKMITQESGGKARDARLFPGTWGNAQWSQAIYFHLLNCGIRIPPSAGSGSGVAPNPVGYNRVYVYVDGKFSYEKWWEGLRAGRVVLTNGPLLVPSVNGQPPGHLFRFERGQQPELEIGLTLSIRDPEQQPISYLEIIQDGQPARSIRFADYAKSGRLPKVRFSRSGWFLIRAVTDVRPTYRFAMTGPYWVEIGYERPISKRSAQFFLDWVYERAKQIELDDPQQRREVFQYHREARDFWQELLSKANRD